MFRALFAAGAAYAAATHGRNDTAGVSNDLAVAELDVRDDSRWMDAYAATIYAHNHSMADTHTAGPESRAAPFGAYEPSPSRDVELITELSVLTSGALYPTTYTGSTPSLLPALPFGGFEGSWYTDYGSVAVMPNESEAELKVGCETLNHTVEKRLQEFLGAPDFKLFSILDDWHSLQFFDGPVIPICNEKSTLISKLTSIGIKARPVCDSISISETLPEIWQKLEAIEAKSAICKAATTWFDATTATATGAMPALEAVA